jgi:hypothetical protein
MRGSGKWMWGWFLAACMVAAAQQNPGLGAGAHPAVHTPQAQMPDSFVSQPGRAIFAPGQAVITPGQAVFSPGKSVFLPGQEVLGPGNQVFPAPSVLTPFHSRQGYSLDGHPARRHYHYRRDRGEGYAAPYLFGSGYWESPYDLSESDGTYEDQNAVSAAPAPEPALEPAPAPAASNTAPPFSYDKPSGHDEYRPAYHAAASVPNEVRRQEPELTVVMKDGTRRRMRNYAITPTTLMDLDAAATGREMNIPLKQVNVTATQKAAARDGLSFSVPKG